MFSERFCAVTTTVSIPPAVWALLPGAATSVNAAAPPASACQRTFLRIYLPYDCAGRPAVPRPARL
jgi:hypothetical protein